jgi:exosortase A
VSGGEAQSGDAAAASADTARGGVYWRALAALALVAATFAALWPGTASLVEHWEDGVRRTYTHGYAVLAISAWLIWRARARLAAERAAPFAPALLLAAAIGVAWLVAFRAGLQILHQLMLPALAASAILTAFGFAVLRRMAFALAFLYLAIPIWDLFLPLLQLVSVLAVRTMLRVADIPAYFQGNTIEIPAGAFEIADGCSGLHFFVVGVTIALLYGEVNRDTLRARIKLIVFACLLSMATNWLRIFVIVLAGHLTDMQHTLVANEHYSFGWFMFAGAMVIFFLVVRRWPAVPAAAAPPPPATAALSARGMAMALLALLLVPAWLAVDGNRAEAAALARSLPPALSSLATASTGQAWRPVFQGADAERFGRSDGVEIYVAQYATVAQGREPAARGNSVTGDGWRRLDAGDVPAPWRETRARNAGGETWVFREAYRLGTDWYRGSLRLQLAYGMRSLVAAPAVSVIALRARCGADCEAAAASLDDFIHTELQ